MSYRLSADGLANGVGQSRGSSIRHTSPRLLGPALNCHTLPDAPASQDHGRRWESGILLDDLVNALATDTKHGRNLAHSHQMMRHGLGAYS